MSQQNDIERDILETLKLGGRFTANELAADLELKEGVVFAALSRLVYYGVVSRDDHYHGRKAWRVRVNADLLPWGLHK